MTMQRTAGRLLPWCVAAIALGIFLFDVLFHEYWRDEAAAALLAQAVPWDGFFVAMRVEGVPMLFHAVLKLVHVVLPLPWALPVVGLISTAVLLFGTYRLLFAISGSWERSLLLTLAFGLTYTYAYELGVVVRQYTLGLGAALASLGWLRDGLRQGERRAVVWGTLSGIVAALASAHSACVAGAGLLVFGCLALVRRGGVKVGWPVLLALPAFWLVRELATPFPGRTAEGNVEPSQELITQWRLGLQAVATSVMPNDWWEVESLSPHPRAGASWALARWGGFVGVVLATATALAGRAERILRRLDVESFDVAVVVVSWLPLGYVFANYYWGFYRHHLFLAIPAFVIMAGWAADRRLGGWHGRVGQVGWLVLMAPWFAFQYALSYRNLALDVAEPFDDCKATAQLLGPNSRLVSEVGWSTVSCRFWRSDIIMHGTDGAGRRVDYLVPDNAWHQRVPVAPLLRQECEQAPEQVYFAGRRSFLRGGVGRCVRPIEIPRGSFVDRPTNKSRFDLFEVDCPCLGVGR